MVANMVKYRAELQKHTVAQLKELLKEKGVTPQGRKADLIELIVKAYPNGLPKEETKPKAGTRKSTRKPKAATKKPTRKTQRKKVEDVVKEESESEDEPIPQEPQDNAVAEVAPQEAPVQAQAVVQVQASQQETLPPSSPPSESLPVASSQPIIDWRRTTLEETWIEEGSWNSPRYQRREIEEPSLPVPLAAAIPPPAPAEPERPAAVAVSSPALAEEERPIAVAATIPPLAQTEQEQPVAGPSRVNGAPHRKTSLSFLMDPQEPRSAPQESSGISGVTSYDQGASPLSPTGSNLRTETTRPSQEDIVANAVGQGEGSPEPVKGYLRKGDVYHIFMAATEVQDSKHQFDMMMEDLQIIQGETDRVCEEANDTLWIVGTIREILQKRMQEYERDELQKQDGLTLGPVSGKGNPMPAQCLPSQEAKRRAQEEMERERQRETEQVPVAENGNVMATQHIPRDKGKKRARDDDEEQAPIAEEAPRLKKRMRT